MLMRTMSSPSSRMRPSTMRAASGSRRSSESAVMLLPEPDSPTSPSVSPSRMRKLTPSTARVTPHLVKRCVCRSCTSRTTLPPCLALFAASFKRHSLPDPLSLQGERVRVRVLRGGVDGLCKGLYKGRGCACRTRVGEGTGRGGGWGGCLIPSPSMGEGQDGGESALHHLTLRLAYTVVFRNPTPENAPLGTCPHFDYLRSRCSAPPPRRRSWPQWPSPAPPGPAPTLAGS